MPSSQHFNEDSTSRFVTISLDGMRLQIHCNDTGELSNQSSTVVLLHGSGPGVTGWSNFSRTIGPLAEAGNRVLSVTCPGWGKSDTVVSHGFRSEFNGRVLLEVLKKFDVQQPINLIGNSMGAHSAVAFSLAEPERIKNLVLIAGGTGSANSQRELPEGLKRMYEVYRTPSLSNLRRMLETLVCEPANLKEDVVQALWASIMSRPEHLENFVLSLDSNPYQYPDVCSRLGEISAPTLLIWGREDHFVPLDIGLRLLKGLCNAEMHVIGNCGHGVMMEHAHKVNRLVLDFFSR